MIDEGFALGDWQICVAIYSYCSDEPLEFVGFNGYLADDGTPVYPRAAVVEYLREIHDELGGLGLGEVLSRHERAVIKGRRFRLRYHTPVGAFDTWEDAAEAVEKRELDPCDCIEIVGAQREGASG